MLVGLFWLKTASDRNVWDLWSDETWHRREGYRSNMTLLRSEDVDAARYSVCDVWILEASSALQVREHLQLQLRRGLVTKMSQASSSPVSLYYSMCLKLRVNLRIRQYLWFVSHCATSPNKNFLNKLRYNLSQKEMYWFTVYIKQNPILHSNVSIPFADG